MILVHQYHLLRWFLSFQKIVLLPEKYPYKGGLPFWSNFFKHVLKHREFQNNAFIWEYPVHKFYFSIAKYFMSFGVSAMKNLTKSIIDMELHY